MLTPLQAARLLGVSRDHIYRLMSRRQIPYYKMHGPRRLAKADVIAYRDSCRVQPRLLTLPTKHRRRKAGCDLQIEWDLLTPSPAMLADARLEVPPIAD
jgi:excisionase family DNA binding protein